LSALDELHAVVRSEGGPVALELAGRPRGEPAPQGAMLAGPRTAGRMEEYGLVVESIHEGYELHHAQGRLFDGPDGDLAVLLGDHMYALGIERLVQLGDVHAVGELADTIAIASLAAARGEPELAAAAWAAGARSVASGPAAEHLEAKALALEGEPAALDAMRTSSGQLGAD